jgi:hypothetical protein
MPVDPCSARRIAQRPAPMLATRTIFSHAMSNELKHEDSKKKNWLLAPPSPFFVLLVSSWFSVLAG